MLKGGNALSLVYGLTTRTSLDLDFSMAGDFEDLDEAKRRIFPHSGTALMRKGMSYLMNVCGKSRNSLAKIRSLGGGGDELSFKLVEREKYVRLKHRPDKLRIDALVTGTQKERKFTIDLSKCEYTEGKAEREVDHFTVYVYTPEMILLEKLRAICQQMPEYEHKGRATARTRNFYDIYRVITGCGIDLAEAGIHELATHIFAAKRVPLSFLANVGATREFHLIGCSFVRVGAKPP